jgi:hypothetical protein
VPGALARDATPHLPTSPSARVPAPSARLGAGTHPSPSGTRLQLSGTRTPLLDTKPARTPAPPGSCLGRRWARTLAAWWPLRLATPTHPRVQCSSRPRFSNHATLRMQPHSTLTPTCVPRAHALPEPPIDHTPCTRATEPTHSDRPNCGRANPGTSVAGTKLGVPRGPGGLTSTERVEVRGRGAATAPGRQAPRHRAAPFPGQGPLGLLLPAWPGPTRRVQRRWGWSTPTTPLLSVGDANGVRTPRAATLRP